jgi:general secretion pathway protein L
VPGKTLGLDISADSITAVQVTSGLKGYQITACARFQMEDSHSLDDALKELFQKMDLKSDSYFAPVRGEDVSYRNLRMPFREPKKIRSTLPFEIETLVPFQIDDLIVDFNIIERADQSEVLAVSVKKDYVAQYLAQLQTYGIDPRVLDIRGVPTVSWLLRQEGIPDNGLFLDLGSKVNTMILYLKRRIVLIRASSFDGGPIERMISHTRQEGPLEESTVEQIESSLKGFCATVQNTIHAFAWQSKRDARPEKVFFTGLVALYPDTGILLNRFLGIQAEMINLRGNRGIRIDRDIAHVWNPALMDNALALALRDEKRGQGFNFRKNGFEVKRQYLGLKREIRKVGVFLILIISFLAADLGVDYYLLKRRYVSIEQKITEIFRQSFPDVKRVVDPVQQMKVKINELKSSEVSLPGIKTNRRVLDLLKEISGLIPKSMDVLVTRMVVDPETVRITGETDTFNTVDSIKSGLEASDYFSAVTITSANLDRTGKRVQFEINLQRAR